MKKISKRFEELIERGKKLHTSNPPGKSLWKENPDLINDQLLIDSISWKLSSMNLLKQVYGDDSDYYNKFCKVFPSHYEDDYIPGQYAKEFIVHALGILITAKEEYDFGFTDKISHILALELYDDILGQARQLLKKGFKDPAAILGRIIIEGKLKDLCEREKITYKEGEGASSLNEKLKDEGIFTLHQFKICRINIELGNNAAHGKFDKYAERDVERMIDYIEDFLLSL